MRKPVLPRVAVSAVIITVLSVGTAVAHPDSVTIQGGKGTVKGPYSDDHSVLTATTEWQFSWQITGSVSWMTVPIWFESSDPAVPDGDNACTGYVVGHAEIRRSGFAAGGTTVTTDHGPGRYCVSTYMRGDKGSSLTLTIDHS